MKEEKENKFLILYNNGQAETVSKMSITLLHMVELGVAKIIFNCNENKAWIRQDDGTTKEVTITHVNGLS